MEEGEKKGGDVCCAPNVQESVCKEFQFLQWARQEVSTLAMRPSCGMDRE